MTLSRRVFFLQTLGFALGTGGVGGLAGAQGLPGVLLARNAPAGLDPTGYLVSEKFDGVRALWDGKTLRFRSGRTVPAPAWFLAKLPVTPLDGELWLARGQFDALSAIVRKAQPHDADWQRLTYWVFELPGGDSGGAGRAANADGADGAGGAVGTRVTPAASFEQRALQLQQVVQAAGWPALQAVAQERVAHSAALKTKLAAVVKAGGEGLMLHLASAPLTSGRSGALLKLKPVQDAEALVLAHVPGKGKYANMLGALQVQTPEGQRFKLGTGFTDAQRQAPPAIGQTVTYTYRDLTPSGKPRFASFLRVLPNE